MKTALLTGYWFILLNKMENRLTMCLSLFPKKMIYKKRCILKNNMVSVKAAKKYFDFLLHLSTQKRRDTKQYKNVWDRKKDLTTSKRVENDTLCKRLWKDSLNKSLWHLYKRWKVTRWHRVKRKRKENLKAFKLH